MRKNSFYNQFPGLYLSIFNYNYFVATSGMKQGVDIGCAKSTAKRNGTNNSCYLIKINSYKEKKNRKKK